ncbi:hypothetical protein AGABI2DRAFT_116090 [Agaricus bisporus var. bisporus H97]|uniref:hypothetical protein n=1 Tax=Agaricus bisporus var. bisporus (strain H97 / ATCC MYA-4626 / FGSC 10389) TaxID=936046 RepID=UPI00029F5F2A|nr:hypothetical protein AGABI2DRAFT_116090 [Agaricus bisporus var. bisporus H97]EKV49052.1 hypothetical protein AGABI2DRAFT_116090 [Agaricus bisporus var. bisporus H97]
MGFVNFPGSDHEPAKSGPVVAQNLAHVYREYLLDLETAYLRTWIANAHARMNNPGMQHPGGPGGLPNGMAANGQQPRFSPQLLQYAHMSTAELRHRGVPENVIAMVDQVRPQLQRTLMEQKRFQQQVRMNARNGPGMAGVPVDANGMQPPNQGAMINEAGQQNGSAAMMLRQQMMKHPMMNGAGGMDARFNPFHAQYPQRNLEMTKNAMEAINRMKEDCKKGPQLARFMQANIEIPYDQQAEFNRLLDATYRQAQDLDQKLHLLHVILPSCTQRVIIISNIVATQRQLKSTSQPRYILSLDLLRNLASELQKIVEMFTTAHMQKQYARMQPPGQQHQLAQLGQVPNQPPQPPGMSNHPGPHPHQQPPPSGPNNMNGTAHSPPGSNNMLNLRHSPMQQPAHQQHPQPPQQQQQQQPMQIPPQQGLQVSQQPQAPSPSHMPSNRGASINLQAPPHNKKKAQNAPTPNTAPSPAAAASTPAPTNAPTPTAAASSPAAPKSPKGKAKAKQPGRRKMSTAPNPAPTPSSAPVQAPAQAPPEAAQHQPPTTNGSGKRPREEDAPSGNMAPSPAGGSNAVVDQPSPPKRSKLEWGDGSQSEELQQKKAQVENVKTEEDTSQLLEDIIKIVGGDPVRDNNGFAELSMLLKGYTQPGSADDLASFPSLEPPLMMKDDLEQYFDFSLGGEDDDSKTPELLSSSSTTDTSPGSNAGNEPTSEGAAAQISNEIKNEESLDFTPLTHLGLWSGVDGGESAYYQTSDWKWDNTMGTQDPWAISTS